jgi:carboxyl-terminal processing protease
MALKFGLLHRDRSLGLWTERLGPQPFHGKTAMLVDRGTRSAAEMVAGFGQDVSGAILVGERTPGQVLGAANFKLPGDYRLRIPVTGWYMPDGEQIEGCGIRPSEQITASLEELRDKRDVQMDRAVAAVLAL